MMTGSVAMSNFRTIDRQTGFLLPPSVDEWLPERHLARFVVEVIDGLDLRAMSGSYRGSGSASYHPRMLLGILVYGYATGVFSSRKLERATYNSVAFRFIAANDHPDHDTIAAFRRRFLKEIEGLFVQVLLLPRPLASRQRLREEEDSRSGPCSPLGAKNLPFAKVIDPAAAAAEDRTPRPQLDRDHAQKIDHRARQHPFAMPMLATPLGKGSRRKKL